MLLSKILKAKRLFTKENGETLVDLISSTFSFERGQGPSPGFIRVGEFEAMRPDLVSNRIYSSQQYYEPLLKYNGISNPFSLATGEILLAPPFRTIDEMIISPRTIVEKGIERTAGNDSKIVIPKTVKDKKRLDELRNTVKEVVPPNVNLSSNKNVKVRDGRVIFGEDVTQVNKDNCPVPISRARLIQQLTKANLF